MFSQVVLGSVLLILCALLHVACVASSIPILKRLGAITQRWGTKSRSGLLLCAGIGIILFAHSVEIWLWALSFAMTGAFDAFETSFYFATVTYTTLGYGDIVVGEASRIFASFAAITGLLTFGISTAFLIGLLGRVMPDVFDQN